MKSARRAKDIDRCVEGAAGFAADMSEQTEAGQPGDEWSGDAVGDGQVESGDPARAESDEEGCADGEEEEDWADESSMGDVLCYF